jgi:N-acetylglucosamine-6-phosphate deacetylase
MHVEGPFLSPDDGPRGAHNLEYIREPDFREFEEWQAAAEGGIVYVTVAPERRGAIAFIEKVVATGVVVSLGHHNAGEEDIRRAVDAGAVMSTHLGNGSHTLLPRLKNYLWQQLANDELIASIISDGFHLPSYVVEVIARTKGLERLILVSDVAQFGGYEPGVYRWEEREVEVFNDGHLGLPGTTILAGAAHLLDWDLPRFIEFTGHGLNEAVRLCTQNPTAILKMPPGYGELREDISANLCLFRYSPGDERLSIEKTICNGEVVFDLKSEGAET